MRPPCAGDGLGWACATTADRASAGLGLTVALAAGSQVLARRLRIPSLVVLLPARLATGSPTRDVGSDHPRESGSSP
ncbi:MAG TPA: hypothetical protein VFD01_15915 [Candidatus Dormibacteraeota bacterium]|jgi:hypothetical protein|nr:hypothetical protein [Candidatus Dormibacteraeota bacterium]